MTVATDFNRIFGMRLEKFWGRPGLDFDGVVRQWPNNTQGFDLETFVRAFDLRVNLKQPVKALRTLVLGLVEARWGEEAVSVIGALLPSIKGRPGKTAKKG